MASKRDGRSLTDLAMFCDDMQQHVRGLTKSLRAEIAQRGDGTPGSIAPTSQIIRSLRTVASSLQELFVTLPSVPRIEGQPAEADARFLALGLVSLWLDRDAELAQKARRGIHGHSESIDLASVVELIAVQRKTGLLRVRALTETILLEFEDGDVVHAMSDNAPDRDRLGEILVDQGSLDRDVLRDLLMKYRGSRRKLGSHFEIQKLVGEEGLKRALEEQVQRLFNRLFAAKDAYFEFIEDAGGEQLQKVRMGAMSLLLESAHVVDNKRDEKKKLSGNIDLDEILSDDETRMQIVANAAQASASDVPVVDAAPPESSADDAEASLFDESASEPHDEPHAESDDSDEPDDAVSFLRKYGIGTKKWIAEMPKTSGGTPPA